jgi:hypothetical protein
MQMITKFNLFENHELGQRYWKILVDDTLFVSLDKIGMPDDVKNELYEHLIDIQDHKNYKFVMVGEDNYGGEMSDWHWDFNQNRTHDEFYAGTEEKYKYQGVVEVTQDEIDEWKLKNDAKKYNL